MPFFLRQAKWANWQGKRPIDDEARARSREDFTLSAADTDGLSVFEVATNEERRLVIAAIACNRMRVNNVDLLEVSDTVVRGFGEVVPSVGGLPVPRANDLHRSLPWEQATLDALADHLGELSCCATRHRKDVVRAAVRELAPADVEEGPHRQWVATLRGAS